MKEVNNNWQIKSLGEVATVKTGYPFDSNLFNEEEGFPVIRIRDIKRGATSTYYKGEIIEDYLVKNGDYLIGMDGEFNLAEWKSDDALLNQRACKIVFNDQMIDPRFGFYFLPKKLKEIEDSTSFVTVKHISHKQILKIQIPIPPLPIQKQIAEILEQADKAKLKRKEANKLTDEFLQSVFIEMFGDPVKNPKGWETKLIAQISKVGTGGTPSREIPEYFTGDIPWVKTTEVTNNRIFDTEEKITKQALKESNCTMFPKGTIVIALYGQGLTRGRTSILEIEACTNQACGTVLPSEKIDSIFLWKQLLHFYHHLRSISRGGNQPNLNLSFIKNLRIILPPLHLQQQFAEIVNKTEVLKEKQKQSEQELEKLFQSLMQKAFKGELVS